MSGLKGKKILLVSPEAWEHIELSKHHYAKGLAEKGNEVFFLGPPGKRFRVCEKAEESLWILEYPGFPKGLRFLPSILQRRSTLRLFRRLEATAGSEFDLIWNFDNSVFFRMDALPSRLLKVLHIVDLDQDFQTKKAASTADICFCTTPFIQQKLTPYKEAVHRVGHGLHTPPIPVSRVELPGQNAVKALFAGNLRRKYLDWDLLSACANELPQVDLIFLGPGKDEVDHRENPTEENKLDLFDRPNVHHLNPVPSEELLSYYASADILLAPYRRSFWKQMADPHKMLEYLASGTCVVATWTESYNELEDKLLRMVERNEEFPELLKHTVDNINYYNASDLIKKRKEYAQQFTYKKRIEEIEGYLAPIMKKKGLIS